MTSYGNGTNEIRLWTDSSVYAGEVKFGSKGGTQMIRDGKEHICSGCFQVIASHDPEAYQRGDFYYHCAYHEIMHRSRDQKPHIVEQEEEFVVVPLALE